MQLSAVFTCYLQPVNKVLLQLQIQIYMQHLWLFENTAAVPLSSSSHKTEMQCTWHTFLKQVRKTTAASSTVLSRALLCLLKQALSCTKQQQDVHSLYAAEANTELLCRAIVLLCITWERHAELACMLDRTHAGRVEDKRLATWKGNAAKRSRDAYCAGRWCSSTCCLHKCHS